MTARRVHEFLKENFIILIGMMLIILSVCLWWNALELEYNLNRGL